MGWSFRKIFWLRSIVTTIRCSVICFTVRVFGTFTSIPDCSTGSVIMKITSSTSTTSTSGVILISASDDLVCPVLVENATFGLFGYLHRAVPNPDLLGWEGAFLDPHLRVPQVSLFSPGISAGVPGLDPES